MDALVTLSEALVIREGLAEANRDVALFKTDLADTLANMGRLQAALRRKAEALNSFRRAIRIRKGIRAFEDIMLYNTACELSMCIPMLEKPEADRTADEAIRTLKDAVAHGYRNLGQFRADEAEALAPIRDRPEFRKLMESLAKGEAPR